MPSKYFYINEILTDPRFASSLLRVTVPAYEFRAALIVDGNILASVQGKDLDVVLSLLEDAAKKIVDGE